MYFKDRYQLVMINEAIRLQVNGDYCQAYDKLQKAGSILPLKENSTDFLNEMKKKCENH